MYIHTVKPGETLYHIARKYGTAALKIAENNGLGDPDKLSVGQKLIILTPTRTYTVRGGDTLDRISKRFGISKRNILQNNPYLSGKDKTYPQLILALKYDTPRHGTAVVNGYMYRGCPEDKITLSMPYINYLTVAAYKAECGRIIRLFDDGRPIEIAKENKRIPVMRIYDKRPLNEILSEADDYSERISNTARARGYGGVTLGAYNAARDPAFSDFLLLLKRRLMEDGLFLFTEIDANSEYTTCDGADGTILCYEKCHEDTIPSFDEGERKTYTEYAERCDAAKVFIDLSPFAYDGKDAITKKEAEMIAYKTHREILYDPQKMISHFEYNKFSGSGKEPTRVAFDSPENTKAKLDLVSELGYMGISYDIMRSPTSDLMTILESFCVGADYLTSSADI